MLTVGSSFTFTVRGSYLFIHPHYTVKLFYSKIHFKCARIEIKMS